MGNKTREELLEAGNALSTFALAFSEWLYDAKMSSHYGCDNESTIRASTLDEVHDEWAYLYGLHVKYLVDESTRDDQYIP